MSVKWAVADYVASEVFVSLSFQDFDELLTDSGLSSVIAHNSFSNTGFSFQLNIDLNVSQNIVELFEDGHEIPFIARYRRHLTQNASPDDLRHALKAFEDAKFAFLFSIVDG